MISKGQKIFPYIGESRQGGKYTAYQVQNRKRIGFQNGLPVMANHGWITIIATEDHPLEEKSGVGFRLKEITGVDVTEYPKGSGKYKTTIWAELEWDKKINRNEGHLEDDIPDDFQDL